MRHNLKSLIGPRRRKMNGHFVEALVANMTPIDTRWLLVISPMNIRETSRVGGFDNVQEMIGTGRLENQAHPLPALYGVPRKIENDRRLQDATTGWRKAQ